MSSELAAAVVLYNMTCGESETCQALRALPEGTARVLVYDNSTRELGNRAACREAGWTYLGGTGNVGLSRAYNACIDTLTAQGFTGYLCLLDGDTALTPGYFSALQAAVATGGEIFVPFLYAGGKLLSPCRIGRCFQTRLFASEAEAAGYTGTDLTAVNSAMAVSMALFADYRYDEGIFLDGVDHTFLRDMADRGYRCRLVDYRCSHGFSGMEKPSREQAVTRFRSFAADYRYIFRHAPWRYGYLVGKRALKLSVQYATVDFIRCFLEKSR